MEKEMAEPKQRGAASGEKMNGEDEDEDETRTRGGGGQRRGVLGRARK